MDQLIYESITAVDHAIRVFDILPSVSFDAPIEGVLRVVLLSEAEVEYDSLSWCWGPAGNNGDVIVNGQSLTCRKTLEIALRYLRKSDEVLTLWIDAVCINQSDMDEKAQQVRMMDQIYRRATRVRIWLGEATEQTVEGFDVFEKLIAGHKLSNFNDGMPISKRQIDAYNSIYQRPWFDRIWVTQEFVLSRERVMHLGDVCFPITDIAALESMSADINTESMEHYDGKLKHLFEYGEVGWMEPTGKALGTFVDQARNFQEDFNSSTTPKVVMDTLVSSSARKSTDLRDKIYGCLGIVPTLAPCLEVDYSYSTEDVYTLATYALIAHYQGLLYALCFLAPLEEKKSANHDHLALPSWVCDFSQDLRRDAMFLFSIFTATVRPGIERNVFVQNSCLVTTGAFFDEIVACQPASIVYQDGFIKPYSHFDISKQDAIHTAWRAFFGMSDSFDERAYVGGGSLEDAYWRTIVCDVTLHKSYYDSIQRTDTEDVKHMSGWILHKNSESLPPFGSGDEQYPLAKNYVQTANRWFSEHSPRDSHLFITRRGYIGHATGRRSVQAGDHIYFLDVGEIPWILRPVPTEEDAKAFEIRAECYVHSIMDGEGLKPSVSKDSDVDKWTEHELRKEFYGGHSFDTELPVSGYGDVWLV